MASHVSMAGTLPTGRPKGFRASNRTGTGRSRARKSSAPTLRGVRVAVYDMADPEFPVSLVELDEQPLPGPAWARVEVALAGICGSDLHNVFPDGSGSRIFGPFVGAPMEMGH